MVLSPALTPRARKEVLAMRVVDIKEQLRARGLPTSGLKAALQTRLAEAIQRERDAAAQQDEHDDAGEGQHEAETDGAPGTLLEDGSAEVSGGVDATRGAHDTGGGHAPGASSTEQHIDDAFAAFEFAFRNSGSSAKRLGSLAPKVQPLDKRCTELRVHNVDSMLERSRVSLGAAGGASGGPSAPKSAPQARIRKEAADFFEFKPTAMTEEVKQDVELVKLRNFLDRKRHYKGSDHKWKPTTFQMGTVVTSAQEYYSSKEHLNRKKDKTVMADLLADDSTRSYAKRRFGEVQRASQRGGKNAYNSKKKKVKWG